MKKVFIYVGHSNWGKSRTLKVITGGSSQQRTAQIAGHTVKVRKMSNDDIETALLEWVRTLPHLQHNRFIMAFCPHVYPQNGNPTTSQQIALDILIELQKTNDLYFFVQQEQYGHGQNTITQNEILWMQNFGVLEVFKGQAEATQRAQSFLNFIQKHI